jgi:hypothetical protein
MSFLLKWNIYLTPTFVPVIMRVVNSSQSREYLGITHL